MHKPIYRDYFYLGDSGTDPRGWGFKVAELQRDLQRGVKRLSEDAYSDRYGVTRTSLKFLTLLTNYINISAVQAELKYSEKQHFRLFVKTVDGYTIVFKGVSGGYFGEGSRGCYDILKACGFSDKQCQNVWTKENFRISRRIA